MTTPERIWLDQTRTWLPVDNNGDDASVLEWRVNEMPVSKATEYVRRDPAVLAALPEVRALAERAANEVLTEYRDSQEQMWTFRQEHIHNAIAKVFAAAIRKLPEEVREGRNE